MVEIDRETEGIKCPACETGYAERVKCTPEEMEEYNCGRPYECCARAFVCCACGVRTAFSAPAPELEYE
jgi:hypothetical protein